MTLPSLALPSCPVPVGFFPFLFYMLATSGFAFVLTFATGFDGTERRLIGLIFTCWLAFAVLFCNSKESTYAIFLLAFTALQTKVTQVLFSLRDDADPVNVLVEQQLEDMYGGSTDASSFFLVIGILQIVGLSMLYMSMAWPRRIGGVVLLLLQGVLIFHTYGLSPILGPMTDGGAYYVFMPTSIFATAAMLQMAVAVPDDKTPLFYLHACLVRRVSPLCSVRTLS